LSEEDSKPRIKDIVNSIIDVIFLGTPHRGNMDEITLEEAVIQAACLILRLEVGSARVQSPDMEASILRSRESFIRLWKMYDFRVKTFHEAYDSDCSKSGVSNRMVRHLPLLPPQLVTVICTTVSWTNDRLSPNFLPHLVIHVKKPK
jgi:hypothetical protein